jgi:hypothetical protein
VLAWGPGDGSSDRRRCQPWGAGAPGLRSEGVKVLKATNGATTASGAGFKRCSHPASLSDDPAQGTG